MIASHRKALGAVAALLAVPALSACGSNFSAQTDQIYVPSDGQNSHDGTVDVLHALVVSESPGTGRLVAGLANNDIEEADGLTEVVGAEQDEGLSVTIDGDAEIPPGGLLQLADGDAPVVLVTGPEDEVRAGGFVRLTFTFENGDPATLNVPVLEPGTDYADVEIPEPADQPTDALTDPTLTEG